MHELPTGEVNGPTNLLIILSYASVDMCMDDAKEVIERQKNPNTDRDLSKMSHSVPALLKKKLIWQRSMQI